MPIKDKGVSVDQYIILPSLNSNISLLSDPNLERIHEENIELEQELKVRKKKHDELSEKRKFQNICNI